MGLIQASYGTPSLQVILLLDNPELLYMNGVYIPIPYINVSTDLVRLHRTYLVHVSKVVFVISGFFLCRSWID